MYPSSSKREAAWPVIIFPISPRADSVVGHTRGTGLFTIADAMLFALR